MSETVLNAHTDPAGLAAPAVGLRIECCPGCDAPAEVEWSDKIGSTSGPLELVKIRCLNRHWFLMPAEGLHRH